MESYARRNRSQKNRRRRLRSTHDQVKTGLLVAEAEAEE